MHVFLASLAPSVEPRRRLFQGLDTAIAGGLGGFTALLVKLTRLAVRTAKKVLQTNFESDLDTALKYESVGLSFARRALNDVKESRASFLEKRKGVYTGT